MFSSILTRLVGRKAQNLFLATKIQNFRFFSRFLPFSSPGGSLALTSNANGFRNNSLITTTLRPLLTSSILQSSNASRNHPEYIECFSKPLPVTDEEWKEDKFLQRIHKAGAKAPRIRRHPLDNKPQMRGVVLKTLIRKPKKPNSANRKCVLLRLSNGKEVTAFVPGEGHNLQEHSVVLVQKKRVRDVPGLKLRVIRGAFDCAHVTKQTK